MNKFIVLFLFMLVQFGCAFVAGNGVLDETVAKEFNKEEVLIEIKNILDGMEVKTNIEKANELYRVGLTFTDKGEYEKTVEFIKKAIELDEARVNFHYNLAVAYTYIDSKSSDGEDSYFRAIELKPLPVVKPTNESYYKNLNYKYSYFGLMSIYAQRGEHEKAADILEKGIKEGFKDYHSVLNSALNGELGALIKNKHFKSVVRDRWEVDIEEEVKKKRIQHKERQEFMRKKNLKKK